MIKEYDFRYVDFGLSDISSSSHYEEQKIADKYKIDLNEERVQRQLRALIYRSGSTTENIVNAFVLDDPTIKELETYTLDQAYDLLDYEQKNMIISLRILLYTNAYFVPINNDIKDYFLRTLVKNKYEELADNYLNEKYKNDFKTRFDHDVFDEIEHFIYKAVDYVQELTRANCEKTYEIKTEFYDYSHPKPDSHICKRCKKEVYDYTAEAITMADTELCDSCYREAEELLEEHLIKNAEEN